MTGSSEAVAMTRSTAPAEDFSARPVVGRVQTRTAAYRRRAPAAAVEAAGTSMQLEPLTAPGAPAAAVMAAAVAAAVGVEIALRVLPAAAVGRRV
jgi:hypothetical protein